MLATVPSVLNGKAGPVAVPQAAGAPAAQSGFVALLLASGESVAPAADAKPAAPMSAVPAPRRGKAPPHGDAPVPEPALPALAQTPLPDATRPVTRRAVAPEPVISGQDRQTEAPIAGGSLPATPALAAIVVPEGGALVPDVSAPALPSQPQGVGPALPQSQPTQPLSRPPPAPVAVSATMVPHSSNTASAAPPILAGSAVSGAAPMPVAVSEVTFPAPLAAVPQAKPARAAQAPAAAHADPAAQIAAAALSARGDDGKATLEVQLHPQSLGRITITVEQPSSGPPLVAIAAEKPQTAAMLTHDVAGIVQALDQAGIKVLPANVTVHAGVPAPPAIAAAKAAPADDGGNAYAGADGSGGGGGAGQRQPQPGGQRSGRARFSCVTPAARPPVDAAPAAPDSLNITA
jgi:hypothetical protein